MNQRIMLCTSEVVELEEITYQTLKKKIQRNNIQAVKINTKKGQGFEYRIALENLSEKAQRKYYKNLKPNDINAQNIPLYQPLKKKSSKM